MFPIDSAMMPIIPARQALMILDLQNDFISPSGALPVTQPPGFVDRILDLVRVFRDSGTGQVVWIRSEFSCSRPAARADIITEASEAAPKVRRGRQAATDSADADAEAFLSMASQTRTSGGLAREVMLGDPEAATGAAAAARADCVRKGTWGAELAPAVAAAVDHRRDYVVTKGTYSALDPSVPATQGLVQLLRVNFVHELFVCGSLTNISVFATAMGAGPFGLVTTVLSDCCGYRDPARHTLALERLHQLTGGEAKTAAQVTAVISGALPSLPHPRSLPSRAGMARRPLGAGGRSRGQPSPGDRGDRGDAGPEGGGVGSLGAQGREDGEFNEAAADAEGSSEGGPKDQKIEHTGVSPSMAAISLFGRISTEPPPAGSGKVDAPALMLADDRGALEAAPQISVAELLALTRATRGQAGEKKSAVARERGGREGRGGRGGGQEREKDRGEDEQAPAALSSAAEPESAWQGGPGEWVVVEDMEPLEAKRRKGPGFSKSAVEENTPIPTASEGNPQEGEDGSKDQSDDRGGGDGNQQPTASGSASTASESHARSPVGRSQSRSEGNG